MAADAPRPARALLHAAGALGAAVVAGLLVGGAVALVSRPLLAGAAPDAWDDLAAVALGIVCAGAAGVLAWGVGLVVASRRLFPRGSRAVPVVTALATTGAAVLVVGAVRDVVGTAAPALVVLALAVPTLLVLPWWETRWRRRAGERAVRRVA